MSLVLIGGLARQASADCTTDTSGNDNNLTFTNGAVCATGRTGAASKAINFDGIDGYAMAPDYTMYTDIFNGGGSLSAWIYPTGWGENGLGRIATKGFEGIVDRGWDFFFR